MQTLIKICLQENGFKGGVMKKKTLILNPFKKEAIEFDKFDVNVKALTLKEIEKGSFPAEFYNLKCENGKLLNSYGFKNLTLINYGEDYEFDAETTDVKWIGSSNMLDNENVIVSDFLFFQKHDGTVKYVSLNDAPDFSITLKIFESQPIFTKIIQSGNDAFAFASPDDSLVVLNKISISTYADIPKLMNVIYHYGKVFAITAETANALVYSTETEIVDWTATNTERIELNDERGRPLKLINFNDTLYVFREFGITKIEEYSVNENFSINHIYYSQALIYPETISVFGEKVVFLSREGLFEFDGNSVRKIEIDFIDNVQKTLGSQPTACGFMGKYFLACKVNFEEIDTLINNAVLVIDTEKQTFETIKGVDVKGWTALNSSNFSKLLAIFRGENKQKIAELDYSGNLFSTAFEKKWKSVCSNFGYDDRKKRIDFVKILAKKDCQMKIESDDESVVYDVSGSQEVQIIKINQTGFNFTISFVSNSTEQQEISNTKLYYTVF